MPSLLELLPDRVKDRVAVKVVLAWLHRHPTLSTYRHVRTARSLVRQPANRLMISTVVWVPKMAHESPLQGPQSLADNHTAAKLQRWPQGRM